MSPALSVAARLSPAIRQDIGIQVLARTEPISHLAATHQVSRKFIYQQGDKAQRSLDESFAPTPADDEVLFHLPVTKSWLYQLILGLVLICHSSYRGVVELFRDLFDTPISIGTIHNRLEAVAATAVEMNQNQDLSGIAVGLHDEIYQADKPVLVGVDAASSYCYLLKSVDHRDEDTWGCHLLDVMAQGFEPDYTVADGGSGLRAGQKAVLPETRCHGDVFHIQQQFGFNVIICFIKWCDRLIRNQWRHFVRNERHGIGFDERDGQFDRRHDFNVRNEFVGNNGDTEKRHLW